MGTPPPPPPGDPGSGPESPQSPQAPPPAPGGQPAGQPAFMGDKPNAPGAVAALVLGILSLVMCAPLGPFAIWQGRKAEALVEQGTHGGGGMAKAGWIMGVIATVLLALGVVIIIIAVAAGA